MNRNTAESAANSQRNAEVSESNSTEDSGSNSMEDSESNSNEKAEMDAKMAEKAAKMEAIRRGIPMEPTEGEIVRLRIVYPDGTKLQRSFLASDRFGFVLDLIDLDIFDHNLGFPEFRLCMTMPRKELDRVGIWAWGEV